MTQNLHVGLACHAVSHAAGQRRAPLEAKFRPLPGKHFDKLSVNRQRARNWARGCPPLSNEQLDDWNRDIRPDLRKSQDQAVFSSSELPGVPLVGPQANLAAIVQELTVLHLS